MPGNMLRLLRNRAQNYTSGISTQCFFSPQSRAHEACATIADFFGSLPEQTLNDLTGDLVTEQLDRILASVSCGDDSFIRGLVENEEAFSWVRAAALQSLVIMVDAGLKTREEVIGYFGGLSRAACAASRRRSGASWLPVPLISTPAICSTK